MTYNANLEKIMRRSAVDDRRIAYKHSIGNANDERRYHTAYEWADAIDALIRTLRNQVALLNDVLFALKELNAAQNKVRLAIAQIEKDISREEQVCDEFWNQAPVDFKR